MAGRGVEPARAPSLPAHGRKRPRKSVIVYSAHRSLRLGLSTADVLKKEILLTLAWLGILQQSPAAWLLLIFFSLVAWKTSNDVVRLVVKPLRTSHSVMEVSVNCTSCKDQVNSIDYRSVTEVRKPIICRSHTVRGRQNW